MLESNNKNNELTTQKTKVALHKVSMNPKLEVNV